jgi:DNA-binding CsgD family transcriptional regulator
MEHGKAPARDLAKLLDAVPLPSFLRSSSGRLVHVNPAARRTFPKKPAWLAPRRGLSNLPAWVRSIPLRVGGLRFEALLVDAFDVADEAAHLTPWAERWKLPPRYARVTALLLRGHADKEIAALTGLELLTVRTYVKRILAHTGVHSRAELIRAALKLTR